MRKRYIVYNIWDNVWQSNSVVGGLFFLQGAGRPREMSPARGVAPISEWEEGEEVAILMFLQLSPGDASANATRRN